MMKNELKINCLNPWMKLASCIKVVMNLKKSMYIKNTAYSWGKKKSQNPKQNNNSNYIFRSIQAD